MRKPAQGTLALCLLVAGLGIAVIATGPAAAAIATAGDLPDFEGPVVSINRDARTFRVNDRHAGVVRIRVDKSTLYEHLSGFGALRKGLLVDVEARRSNGQWIAVHVEREHD